MLDVRDFDVLSFDCYGTLIDWESGIIEAIRPVFEKHGVTADDRTILETYAEIESKQEAGGYVRYEVLLRLLMAEMTYRFGFDAAIQELDCLSKSIGDWLPFDDTVPSLEKLNQKYKLAVVSNIDDSLFKKSQPHLQVPFEWVITAQQAKNYKPSHEIFELAIERIGYPRERILHVAQSIYHDIVPARAVGLKTVWVNRRKGRDGFGATPAATADADVAVDDLAQLVGLAGLE